MDSGLREIQGCGRIIILLNEVTETPQQQSFLKGCNYMKNFFAVLLSALVGVFGYTLTDSAIEDRISSLETEIIELRKEIIEHPETSSVLLIGDIIDVSSTSLEKFLLRENNNGMLEFIHPYTFDEALPKDIFVYLTDVNCQVSGFKDTVLQISKGKNYEPVYVNVQLPLITANLKGYTDSALSGKKISFLAGTSDYSLICESIKDNDIQSNGFFECEAVFSISYEVSSFELNTIYYSYGLSYFSNHLPEMIKESFEHDGITIGGISLT